MHGLLLLGLFSSPAAPLCCWLVPQSCREDTDMLEEKKCRQCVWQVCCGPSRLQMYAGAKTQRCTAMTRYLAGPSSSMGVGSCTLTGTCVIIETVHHRQHVQEAHNKATSISGKSPGACWSHLQAWSPLAELALPHCHRYLLHISHPAAACQIETRKHRACNSFLHYGRQTHLLHAGHQIKAPCNEYLEMVSGRTPYGDLTKGPSTAESTGQLRLTGTRKGCTIHGAV